MSSPAGPSPAAPSPNASATLVVVGAGPRATGLLERIAANAPELSGGRRLHIHLVDPYPPGAGRVWRLEQSPLLRMNSMAEDVTMFTDESVVCDGPIRHGPSLAQWAERVRSGELRVPLEPDLEDELAGLSGSTFPTRRLQSAYLTWVFQHTADSLPPNITVEVHRKHAVRITGPRRGTQSVWLDGEPVPLTADVAVLALGHLDALPDRQERVLAAFARDHGLTYLPPEFSADSDLSGIRPGEAVLMRGFGLAFVDLMVLLTEGRGGTYTEGPRGTLRYHPCGQEPVLYVGSRRGVPYHSKIGYPLTGERPPLPRFFGPDAVDALLARPGRLDFQRDIWPLIAKEIGYGYYHRLFTAHPERTTVNWPQFEEKYAAVDHGSAELQALVAASIPDRADRLDLEALDRPLEGLRFGGPEALQDYVRSYIGLDIARRADPRHSADLGAFLALLSAYGNLPRLIASGAIAPRSRLRDIDGWWHGFFSYLASGPPGPRLEQMLALSRAGIVNFVGADMRITTDHERGVFRAGSAGLPGEVEATALIESRLPAATVSRTRDRLLRRLHEDGAGGEEVLRDGERNIRTGLLTVSAEDARVLDGQGRAHPRRFALGAHTNARSFAAFARPGTNAPAFRQNDSTARALLRLLGEIAEQASESLSGTLSEPQSGSLSESRPGSMSGSLSGRMSESASEGLARPVSESGSESVSERLVEPACAPTAAAPDDRKEATWA
ncbi:FAD/NAD(P)-binding protein [Wenjunlia tyrosinilytica]|uniref:FAD/NAD(P)-binding protein n=1 Tax=Wenjunlia tyrosinilytica TaxID=1544741 RepID=UPI001E639A57|nr:FAD/NAD(P)-binding protein [Wenjunlia tyrosinilytica]